MQNTKIMKKSLKLALLILYTFIVPVQTWAADETTTSDYSEEFNTGYGLAPGDRS